MALYQIVAQGIDEVTLDAARTAIQTVPLVWAPYIGVDAWGNGVNVRDDVGNLVSFAKKWGVNGADFYDSAVDTGFDDGTTWNEARAVSVLSAIPNVTITSV